MPLQSRVSPLGDLFADDSRGLLMGNRGGRLHDAHRELATRRWASKQWICCRLDFNNRHRNVWGDSYTELFFLDEVTAFAAGHRPCFECRRKEATFFALLFAGVAPNSVHSRASGNPALGPRFRGDERVGVSRATAAAMDNVLHAERLAGRAKRRHRRAIDALPDGAMIARDGAAFALKEETVLRWTPEGYAERQRRSFGIDAEVLTPPSVLAVLAAGYRPFWHPSAA
jgi:hypothetical protein